mmetsp:Transcript_12509/g.28535  ORF Transcript_12509/g.28535 Transcript_12509/m.28535 type:complete len:277 (+) Transcript_12509:32-862(+)
MCIVNGSAVDGRSRRPAPVRGTRGRVGVGPRPDPRRGLGTLPVFLRRRALARVPPPRSPGRSLMRPPPLLAVGILPVFLRRRALSQVRPPPLLALELTLPAQQPPDVGVDGQVRDRQPQHPPQRDDPEDPERDAGGPRTRPSRRRPARTRPLPPADESPEPSDLVPRLGQLGRPRREGVDPRPKLADRPLQDEPPCQLQGRLAGVTVVPDGSVPSAGIFRRAARRLGFVVLVSSLFVPAGSDSNRAVAGRGRRRGSPQASAVVRIVAATSPNVPFV